MAEEETDWLDEVEMRAWRALLHVHLVTFAEIERALRALGINDVEYGVLAYLSQQPEHSMLIRDLAETSFTSLSRLSHRLDRLESLGYVERRACETDARSTYAVLTDKGFRYLQEIAPQHLKDVRREIFDHLEPDQVAALADALVAIVGRDVSAITRISAD